MTITIPAFWCGVLVTLVVEFVVIIAVCIKNTIADRKRLKLNGKYRK